VNEFVYLGASFLIAIAGLILSALWNRFYFHTGIPVFSRVVDLESVKEEKIRVISAVLHNDENETMGNFGPKILFKEIAENELAFREEIWGSSIFRYFPIMHGRIIIDPEMKQLKVLGLTNWYVLCLPLMYFSITKTNGRSDETNLIFLYVTTGWALIMYTLQFIRYIYVVKYVREVINDNL